MTERSIVQRWDVANAQWTCASCHSWRRDHLETGQCLFGPAAFRAMTLEEFIAWRGTQVRELTLAGTDANGGPVKQTFWETR